MSREKKRKPTARKGEDAAVWRSPEFRNLSEALTEMLKIPKSEMDERIQRDRGTKERPNRRAVLASAPVPILTMPEGDIQNAGETFKVVSLFSGCGGLDLGFQGGFTTLGKEYEKLPFEIVWANDISEPACKTYKRNLSDHIHCGDIWDSLDKIPESADVVIGGFPCQDFSINGKRAGHEGARGKLYKAMVEVVRRLKPKVFVAENVKGLLQKYNKDSLCQVLTAFEDLGYQVSYRLYLAAHYGVPQMRERVFFVGTAPGVTGFKQPAPLILQDAWITAKQAIGDLEDTPECAGINHIWSRAELSPDQGNRIIKADRPADTIRAECHGNIQWHYNLQRRISMREAARFQSFPDTFIFESKLRETERQVGNAVPPVLGWHIARAVLDCLR